jgi:serine-type D-Ala-D-Ala carboxypeptidase/endopeptidase (penicillin-binding protein 4)
LLGLTLVPQEVGQPLQVVWDDPVSGRPWRIDNRSQTVAPTAEEFLAVGRDLGQPILRVRGQLRAGSASESVAIAIPQPARHFLQQFRQALRRQGVEVKRSSITIDPSATPGTIIASVNSATLAKLLMEANQASNNLYAESLLRTLGNQEANTDNLANRDSLAAGLEAMSKALTRLGVARAGYELVDGSGLARRDRVTARALVQTLQAMGRSPNAATFRSSLAVAGISGTLKNRFQDTPVVGKFQGKTGFLTGAAALSGYLQPPDYHPLVLSILINQFDALGKTQEAIDEVVKLLAQLKKC